MSDLFHEAAVFRVELMDLVYIEKSQYDLQVDSEMVKMFFSGPLILRLQFPDISAGDVKPVGLLISPENHGFGSSGDLPDISSVYDH